MLRVLFSLLIAPALATYAQIPSPAAQAQRAKQAMVSGHFQEAIDIYRGLHRELPENIGITLDLGLALHSAGQYREAIPQFEKVVRKQPGDGPVWLLLGLDRLKLQEPEQARQALEQALRLAPDSKPARLALAEAWMRLRRPLPSIAEYKRLSKTDPQNATVWQGLGLAYVAFSHAAFERLEDVARGSPYDEALLARSLAERRQLRLAFHFYRLALAGNPQIQIAYSGIGQIYRETGHAGWAAIEAEKAKKLPAPDCRVHPLECEFRKGNYNQIISESNTASSPEKLYWRALASEYLAQQTFERLDQLPASAAAHSLMAEAFSLQDQYERAVDEWRKASAMEPGNVHIQAGLARALWLDRQYADAQPILLKLLSVQPESSDLSLEMGDCLLHTSRAASRALPYLERAVTLSPHSQAARAALGSAYLRLNKPRQAIPNLKAALGFDTSGATYYQLAMAYRATHQDTLARQAMAEFTSISKSSLTRTQHLDERQAITAP